MLGFSRLGPSGLRPFTIDSLPSKPSNWRCGFLLSPPDKMESHKWQGYVEMAMAAPLERVWEIVSDFCGMKRWYPALLLCERVEGTPEQGPGCVRYICSASPSSPSGDGILRAKEKLISMDCINHSYTYAVIDISIEGFRGYQATFQVMEREEGSCVVKWYFEVEPIAGRSEPEFVSNWSSVLAAILSTLQQFASSS